MKQQLNKSGYYPVTVQSTQHSVSVFCNDACRPAGCGFCFSSHTVTAQARTQMGGKLFSSLKAFLTFLHKPSAFFLFSVLLWLPTYLLTYLIPYFNIAFTFWLTPWGTVKPFNFSVKCHLLCLFHSEYHFPYYWFGSTILQCAFLAYWWYWQ